MYASPVHMLGEKDMIESYTISTISTIHCHQQEYICQFVSTCLKYSFGVPTIVPHLCHIVQFCNMCHIISVSDKLLNYYQLSHRSWFLWLDSWNRLNSTGIRIEKITVQSRLLESTPVILNQSRENCIYSILEFDSSLGIRIGLDSKIAGIARLLLDRAPQSITYDIIF